MIRLKELRESQGLNMRQVAGKLGMSYTTYISYEKGTREPNYETLKKIAKYYNCSIDYILGNDTTETINPFDYDGVLPIKTQKVPMMGDIACGEPIYANEEYESFVETDSDIHADFCLRAKGDSMINARIMDGDIVFIRKQSAVENGEIAAVIIEDTVTLKRVYLYNNELRLVPENPMYKTQIYVGAELEQVHILGKAIAVQYMLQQTGEKPVILAASSNKIK